MAFTLLMKGRLPSHAHCKRLGNGERRDLSSRCGDDRRVVLVTVWERGSAYISVHLSVTCGNSNSTTSPGEQLCVGLVSCWARINRDS